MDLLFLILINAYPVICVLNACPNGVIKVDFPKGEKGKRVLEEYKMNLGYCLFCGLCVKACPKNAINFKTDFDMVCYQKTDTIYSWCKKAEEKAYEEAARILI